MTSSQRLSKPSLTRRELPGLSRLRSVGSCGSQSGGWTGCMVANYAQMRVENHYMKPRDLNTCRVNAEKKY